MLSHTYASFCQSAANNNNGIESLPWKINRQILLVILASQASHLAMLAISKLSSTWCSVGAIWVWASSPKHQYVSSHYLKFRQLESTNLLLFLCKNGFTSTFADPWQRNNNEINCHLLMCHNDTWGDMALACQWEELIAYFVLICYQKIVWKHKNIVGVSSKLNVHWRIQYS